MRSYKKKICRTDSMRFTKGSAAQIISEISIEYDFAVPKYTVKSIGIH